MHEANKPTLAMYWAAGCGGCEISVLNIGNKILDVDAAFDIVFWPCVADFKYDDVRSYPDRYIDLCLFNGAIRSSENEEMAHLLRQKSKILVAFGSCAIAGCIPALSNLTSRQATLQAVYLDNVTTVNPEGVLPQEKTAVSEGTLHLPHFYHTVLSLDQVVSVDYQIPGCPPEPHQITAVLDAVIAALLHGSSLPPAGATLGAGSVALCEECLYTKSEKEIHRFYRPHEKVPEPGVCLLEQGIVCLGPATRSGCGALCPQVGMGCRGCYGTLNECEDQGARIMSAIASTTENGNSDKNLDEAALTQQIEDVMGTLADPAGTFYRFGMAKSLLHRAHMEKIREGQR